MRGLHVNPTNHLIEDILRSAEGVLRSTGRRVAAGIRVVNAVRRRDMARAMIYLEMLERG
jgi:hypothetical protein